MAHEHTTNLYQICTCEHTHVLNHLLDVQYMHISNTPVHTLQYTKSGTIHTQVHCGLTNFIRAIATSCTMYVCATYM